MPAVGGTAAAPPRLAETCLTKRDDARPVAFRTADGVRIVGALLGTGRVGLVAGHEVNGDLCNWVPFARVLAARGFRVLAIDFRTYGNSGHGTSATSGRFDRDYLGGAAYLRSHGVGKVFLAGASMGGTAAIVAASESPAVAGVISLSGPASFGRLDAAVAIRTLTRPTFLVAGEYDSGFVDDARALYAASPARDKHLDVVARSNIHGTELLRGVEQTSFRQATALRGRLIAFLRTS